MRDRLFIPVLVLLAAALGGGMVWYLRIEQARALAAANEPEAAASHDSPHTSARDVAESARLIRDLKLVTVEIRATVDSQRSDESWRGDVRATVSAPVRLLFGCDLSGVVANANQSSVGAWLRPNLLIGGYTLRVPRPERIASEIDGAAERTDVQVGWARFRDLSGEFHLGQARVGLHEAARALTPTTAQLEEIERLTREQLAALVRAVSGESRVTIEFFDPHADRVAGTASEDPR